MHDITKKCCLNCFYFNNNPEYIEQVFPGLIVLGSGYSSVKRDDGICQINDRYLSGNNVCNGFRERNKELFTTG